MLLGGHLRRPVARSAQSAQRFRLFRRLIVAKIANLGDPDCSTVGLKRQTQASSLQVSSRLYPIRS